jgi:hypothetical protein
MILRLKLLRRFKARVKAKLKIKLQLWHGKVKGYDIEIIG